MKIELTSIRINFDSPNKVFKNSNKAFYGLGNYSNNLGEMDGGYGQVKRILLDEENESVKMEFGYGSEEITLYKEYNLKSSHIVSYEYSIKENNNELIKKEFKERLEDGIISFNISGNIPLTNFDLYLLKLYGYDEERISELLEEGVKEISISFLANLK